MISLKRWSNFKKWTSREKLALYTRAFVWVFLLLALYGALVGRAYFTVFIIILTFILTLTPFFIERRFKIDLPPELEMTIVLFIYATIFLGEVRDFYFVYWWWDALLHFVSAVALGFIGLGVLYTMDKKGKIDSKVGVLVFFAFCFVMAIGAIWEIFEFGMDQIFGLNMQKSGLIDTMWDFITDAIGGLLASIVGYFYIKHERKLHGKE